VTNGTHPSVGAPSGAPILGSCEAAAVRALAAFAFEERLVGAAKAHETFDGILTEHALALEEARDELREVRRTTILPALVQSHIDHAIRIVDEQTRYVRALGSVANSEEEEDAK